jgi:hypothetical protein
MARGQVGAHLPGSLGERPWELTGGTARLEQLAHAKGQVTSTWPGHAGSEDNRALGPPQPHQPGALRGAAPGGRRARFRPDLQRLYRTLAVVHRNKGLIGSFPRTPFFHNNIHKLLNKHLFVPWTH